MGTEIKIFTLYFPGLVLANRVQKLSGKLTTIGSPVVGVADVNGQMRYLVEKFLQDFVLTAAVLPGNNHPRRLFD